MWYFIWNQNNINNDYTVYHRCCKSINNRTSDCNPFKYDFVYDEDIYQQCGIYDKYLANDCGYGCSSFCWNFRNICRLEDAIERKYHR